MSGAIVAALITGAVSLVGTIITVLAASRKTDEAFKISQAVMENRLEELTREVRLHNSFVTRVPVLEEKVANLEKQRKQ